MAGSLDDVRLFGLGDSNGFSKQVAEHLGIPLCSHEDDDHEDTECYVLPKTNCRGTDIYVICSMYACSEERVADKFVKLLFFAGQLGDAAARRITLICPYLAYSRQDRKTKPREGVYTKYLAMLCEAMGVSRLITMDIHSLQALQNSFRIPVDNLESKNGFARYIKEKVGVKPEKLAFLSPDIGGFPRCRYLRNRVASIMGYADIPIAVFDKSHIGRHIEGAKIIGGEDLAGKTVVQYDDMISGGTTSWLASRACVRYGGVPWAVCAAHGLFVGNANEKMTGIARIVVSDTVRPWRLSPEVAKNVVTINTTKMFAEAIRVAHDESGRGSISNLLERDDLFSF